MRLKLFFIILSRIVLSILLIIVILWALLQTTPVQNWLVGRVTDRLSKDLKTRIHIDHIDIDFFNQLKLKGVFIEDQKKDTLLSAGTVQVRITDWFFFKDKAELKYIGLENAVINLNRTDSVWNYHYLEQYFASSSTQPKKESGLDFNFKLIELKNVAFAQRDGWTGRDMIFSVGELTVDAEEISLPKAVININDINLVDPFFHIYDYEGNRPPRKKIKSKAPVANPDSLQWNTGGINIAVKNLSLKNGTFKNDRDGLNPTLSYFDPEHLSFTGIGGQVKNIRWAQDTIRAVVKLAAKERSGLQVQNLQANFRFHPQLMEFSRLNLKTNRSELKNYFAMRYDSLNSMSNFIEEVQMQGTFLNSFVHTDDIAFFAPDIKGVNRVLKIDGKVKGTVDNFLAKDITLQTGRSFYKGDVAIKGLPNISSAFIQLNNAHLRTNYTDLASFVPSLRSISSPNIKALSQIYFAGNFKGFIDDFAANGTLQTNLGNIVARLNMKFPDRRPPQYSGKIVTNAFDLGRFINNSQLGSIAFSGEVNGQGFTESDLDINIDGTISKLHFNGYTYQNITAKGQFSKKIFNGNVVIKDPGADLSLNGLINLKGRVPLFDVHANIEQVNLQSLHLFNSDLVLKGIFDLNFSGNTLNNFNGSARISNAQLLSNGAPLSFDSLAVFSNYDNGIRTLKVFSNELDASVQGKFDLETLPEAFILFLNRYYPSYIRAPRKALPKQSFTFDISTGYIEDFIKLVDKNLSGFNNSHISGYLNVDSSAMNVTANIPQFGIAQYQFSDVSLKGDGNLERLILKGEVSNAVISDSLSLPLTTFNIQAQNDISDITINTIASQTINKADLSAQVQTFSDGFKLFLNPSSFVLNGKTWSIEEGGELDFRKNTVVHGQVVLKETSQEIRLTTQPSDIGDWNDLLVKLQNVNLGDLSPLLIKTNRIDGLLSGEIHVEDPQNKFNVTANIFTDQLRVDNDSIGRIVTSVFYNNNSGLISGRGNNTDPEHQLSFELSIDIKDSANAHNDRISVATNNYPVKILERFVGDLFSDLQGYVTGSLDIVGEGANRDYIGKASLHNAGLKVVFTQVFYTVEDTEIELTENKINLGTLKLKDRFGNTATAIGNITHKSFGNMVFDIVVETDSKQMELINTTYNDNQTFYGRAMGAGTFVLVGPQNDILMNIDITASDTDSSYVTLPPSKYRESGLASFMVEKKYGREMTSEDLKGGETNITYRVNLNANPMVNIEVVLDELTGDIIKGRGTGNLRISSGTFEPLAISGRYDISEGSYLFTFQSFFKKPFVLRPNTTNYIEWTGDPYDATIHFTATYKAEEVSFAPLVSAGLSINQSLNRYRGDVTVVANLTGELFRPTFNFKLEFPNDVINSDPSLPFAIQQIEKNQNELNKQVTYLIVFNSFAPYEGSQAAGFRPFDELAYSTISGLFFGEVNKRLNQLLSKILNNNDLTVNFTGSLYNRNLVNQSSQSFNINQSNLNISVGRSFFNNRFNITFGSTFDVPLQAGISQNIQFLPDVTAEWVINKSGSIRATFFYRQNLDFLTGATTGSTLRTKRTGASIAYRKEFDSISRFLFGRKKGRLRQDNVDSTNVSADSTKN